MSSNNTIVVVIQELIQIVFSKIKRYIRHVGFMVVFTTIILLGLFVSMFYKVAHIEEVVVKISQAPIIQLEYFGRYYTTAYSDRRAETDDTPRITSTGGIVNESVIAVSQDLLGSKLKYGDVIYIEELHTIRTVGDVMNARWTKRFDVFYNNRKTVDTFGCRKLTYYRVIVK